MGIQAAGFGSDDQAELEESSLEILGELMAVEEVETILWALEAEAALGWGSPRARGGGKAS